MQRNKDAYSPLPGIKVIGDKINELNGADKFREQKLILIKRASFKLISENEVSSLLHYWLTRHPHNLSIPAIPKLSSVFFLSVWTDHCNQGANKY